METSLLLQELEPLNAQIEETQGKLKELEEALSGVEAELGTFSADQQRFEALQEVCNALDKLDQAEGKGLFWDGLPEVEDIPGHLEGLRHRIAEFEEEIRGSREKQESIKEQIEQRLDELWDLEEEVRLAHAREERRKEEFVIEREASQVPYRPAIMPWTYDGESERAFRRALAVAMLLCLLFGSGIPMVNVPLPDRTVVVEIPKRLATLVKKEPPKPEPVREVKKPEKDEEEEKLASESEPKKTDEKQKQTVQEEPKVAAAPGDGKQAARKKAEKTGVLAFKSSFSDLMEEVPVANLGVEAHLSKAPGVPGQAQARRSLVAMEARGGSGGIGGIGNGGYSRNAGVGGGGGGSGTGFGSVGIARVESSMAGLVEEKGRPLSDGPAAGRTDEEIQIVFDRYKATLYRIYNTELRKNPTLRGKILLRITIEPNGELSLCKVESTDLDSPELVAKIIARVQRFNFGPKEDVPKTTILYPIDFLPAG